MPTYQKLVATRLTPHFREAAQIVEADVPEPGPGQVLVRNRYAGVNATDVNITAGRYSADPTLPMDLGAEAVGVVEAVGAGVELTVGQAVATMGVGGGYRELQLIPARYAVPVPEATPEMVALFVSGLTASIALSETGQMGTGETVFVSAAAGGTGQFAVQLAKRAGNTVVGTCGSPEKADALRALGVDRVVNHREEDVRAVLKEVGPIDLAYESVGRAMFDAALAALGVHGRLLVIGYVSEYIDGLESVDRPRVYARLLQTSASIRGFFLPHFTAFYPAHIARLVSLVKTGELEVAVDESRFEGVGSVVDAVEHLHSGASRGKVVVRLS